MTAALRAGSRGSGCRGRDALAVTRELEEQRFQRSGAALERAERNPGLPERNRVCVQRVGVAGNLETSLVGTRGPHLEAGRPEPRVVGGMVVAGVQNVKRRRRAQPQLFDAAGIHDPAVIDDRQLVAQLFDLGHVVAAQHHGHSLARPGL